MAVAYLRLQKYSESEAYGVTLLRLAQAMLIMGMGKHWFTVIGAACANVGQDLLYFSRLEVKNATDTEGKGFGLVSRTMSTIKMGKWLKWGMRD